VIVEFVAENVVEEVGVHDEKGNVDGI